LSQAEKARVIQTLLFVSGLNTLLQSLFGTRLPAVVAGSYSYVIPTTSIVLARRYQGLEDPHEVIYLYAFLWLFCISIYLFVILVIPLPYG
jgi:xanthine/uracil permease